MTPHRTAKAYKSYVEQIDLLAARGMIVHDREWAVDRLSKINYYRLSGYWYPFRMLRGDGCGRTDRFFDGSDLRDVVALHDFDARLRAATFTALSHIELTVRARLGHELGRVDPLVHLRPELLGPPAHQARGTSPSQKYIHWRQQYDSALARSREDFVEHHRREYSGTLPVWAAVEVLDWGRLTHLFGMSPLAARDSVAHDMRLSAPQLESWMKSLNILRNYSAHHGRVFNRVFALTPKLPKGDDHPELSDIAPSMNRAFGQLSIVQYLLKTLRAGNPQVLPAVLRSFPDVEIVPISHTGAPSRWALSPLWS